MAQKRGIAGEYASSLRFSQQPSVKRNIPAEILFHYSPYTLPVLSPRWNFIRETLYASYAGN
jgi:hypothetical protein